MGILSRIRYASETMSRLGMASRQTPIRSPWASTDLSKIVWSDVFGQDALLVISRAEAMRVPAIAKGRAVICGTLSRQPLAKWRNATRVASEQWMIRNSGDVSPQTRMLWTLDDLIFSGVSLWALERDTAGHVTDAARVPPEWWQIDDDLNITVLGEQAPADQVCYFEGPQEGLTTIAADTIRGALAIESAWQERVKSPVPIMELHSTDANADLTQEEANETVAAWEKARRGGGTAYTPSSISLNIPDSTADPQLFIEGRNAVRLDVANFLNLPAQLLEGSTATASLTYSTQEGTRNELIDLSLNYWMTPIEQRLSMDDMVPKGSSVQFDVEFLATPTQPTKGPNVED